MDVVSQGFLGVNMFAQGDRGIRRCSVRMVGGRDGDRFNIFLLQELPPIGIPFRVGKAFASCRESLFVDVADGHDVLAHRGLHHIGVSLTSNSDTCDVDRFVRTKCPRPTS